MASNETKLKPEDYRKHWEEQILFRLRNSTPLDRLMWLEEMIKLLAQSGLAPKK